jgi:DNA-binding transcriptional ArsR family regulator
VNGLELLVLGRILMKVAQQAMPDSGLEQLPGDVRPVMMDVLAHPGSSISEITARTRFPQSHVSAAIAALVDAGAVLTAADPKDRRRTLVGPHPDVPAQALQLGSVPIGAALAKALDTDDEAKLREVQTALDTLWRHFGAEPVRPG